MSKLIRDYQLDNCIKDEEFIIHPRKRKKVKKVKDFDEQNNKLIKKD